MQNLGELLRGLQGFNLQQQAEPNLGQMLKPQAQPMDPAQMPAPQPAQMINPQGAPLLNLGQPAPMKAPEYPPADMGNGRIEYDGPITPRPAQTPGTPQRMMDGGGQARQLMQGAPQGAQAPSMLETLIARHRQDLMPPDGGELDPVGEGLAAAAALEEIGAPALMEFLQNPDMDPATRSRIAELAGQDPHAALREVRNMTTPQQ